MRIPEGGSVKGGSAAGGRASGSLGCTVRAADQAAVWPDDATAEAVPGCLARPDHPRDPDARDLRDRALIATLTYSFAPSRASRCRPRAAKPSINWTRGPASKRSAARRLVARLVRVSVLATIGRARTAQRDPFRRKVRSAPRADNRPRYRLSLDGADRVGSCPVGPYSAFRLVMIRLTIP